MKEIYLFDNCPVLENCRYIWDIKYIYEEVIRGLREVKKHVDDVASVGIDGWGVDFWLIEMDGNLIKNLYSYRDQQVSSIIFDITY